MKNKISDRQNMKKPPQKVAYFFFNCPTAQMAEFNQSAEYTMIQLLW